MQEQYLTITIATGLVSLLIGIKLFLKPKTKWKQEAKKKLIELDSMLNSTNSAILKTIIIETDKLLDYCMINIGVKGKTMGERLKYAKIYFVGKYPNHQKYRKHYQKKWAIYNKIWEAHKTRNKLAHEMNYSINSKEIKNHYYHLRTGIKELLR